MKNREERKRKEGTDIHCTKSGTHKNQIPSQASTFNLSFLPLPSQTPTPLPCLSLRLSLWPPAAPPGSVSSSRQRCRGTPGHPTLLSILLHYPHEKTPLLLCFRLLSQFRCLSHARRPFPTAVSTSLSVAGYRVPCQSSHSLSGVGCVA